MQKKYFQIIETHSEKISEIIWSILGVILAFFLGYFYAKENFKNNIFINSIEPDKYQEISILKIKKISGDLLQTDISGPVRILMGGKEAIEGEGEKNIPLGKIPNFKDLELRNFKYVGNAKTRKFYPSTSYPARGTDYRYRRLFNSKKEALEQGFKASKLVK